jgi:hypothetical protein
MALDLGIDAEATLPMFRDYWTGKAGKEARKADWGATWRNWCRREAERKRTNRPGPTELPFLTVVQGGGDPNDGWGIEAWCKTYPGVKAIEGEDAKPSILAKGKWAYGPPGGRKIIDHVARLVAQAAGWEKTMRPDWSLLAQWVDADINVQEIVVPNVKRLADYFRSNGQPATTLKAFDKKIREAKAAA